MKKVALYFMLLFGAVPIAAASPVDYNIIISVDWSHWIPFTDDGHMVQELKATINGHGPYLLLGDEYRSTSDLSVLVPDSYKAKPLRDVHKEAYEYSQAYEILFSDGKTKKFVVVGAGGPI